MYTVEIIIWTKYILKERRAQTASIVEIAMTKIQNQLDTTLCKAVSIWSKTDGFILFLVILLFILDIITPFDKNEIMYC